MGTSISIRTPRHTITVSVPATSLAGWKEDVEIWANVMRNRGRWITASEPLGQLYADCGEQLKQWGFNPDALAELRGERLVEISTPSGDDELSTTLRSLPWEFVVSAALTVRPNAREAPFVVRHLQDIDSSAKPPAPADKPAPVLFVQSAPGVLSRFYNFDSEQRLMVEAFKGTPEVETIFDPTLDELKAATTRHQPSVIHISGIDTRQATHLIGMPSPDVIQAGFCLKSPAGEAIPITAPEIMPALMPDGHKPRLAVFNMYYSPEIAALAVKAGADAAIGFFGEFDDATAEVFFTVLYRAWAREFVSTPSPLQAVRTAFDALVGEPVYLRHVEGAPIVMWLARSIAESNQPQPSPTVTTATAAAVRKRQPSFHDVRAALEPYVQFPQTLNYCSLHNGASLFAKPAQLGVRNLGHEPIHGLCVEVAMDIGSARHTFTRSCDTTQPNYPIERVHLSLTSEMARALRERVQTNITVRFSYQKQDVFRETRQVGISATDEWQPKLPWLPSFVLPRDPIVIDIVRWAQPILSAIADSTETGFDNYQRGTGATDTAGTAAKRERERMIVDQQVQALWWAVRQRCRLTYLAAPPSDDETVQRIRTPTAIYKSRAGTCLDVSLMFAACLAAIDLHAVVFVFKGHALPGYFRTRLGHTEFSRLLSSKYMPDAMPDDLDNFKTRPWILERDSLSQIMKLLADGDLVPVEAVVLTERGGFREAVQRALQRMNDYKDRFEAVYDVTLARRNGVTPLPIAGLI
jgi:hypothetical protein